MFPESPEGVRGRSLEYKQNIGQLGIQHIYGYKIGWPLELKPREISPKVDKNTLCQLRFGIVKKIIRHYKV